MLDVYNGQMCELFYQTRGYRHIYSEAINQSMHEKGERKLSRTKCSQCHSVTVSAGF